MGQSLKVGVEADPGGEGEGGSAPVLIFALVFQDSRQSGWP